MNVERDLNKLIGEYEKLLYQTRTCTDDRSEFTHILIDISKPDDAEDIITHRKFILYPTEHIVYSILKKYQLGIESLFSEDIWGFNVINISAMDFHKAFRNYAIGDFVDEVMHRALKMAPLFWFLFDKYTVGGGSE